jgi:hypothetical protein
VSARRGYIGLYGCIAIQKQYCHHCGGYYFVLEGRLSCCGSIGSDLPERYKRETEAEQRRRLPSIADRRRKLEEQGNQCLYCERRFGAVIFRWSRPVKLALNWDHMVPYAYSQNNSGSNFAAACQICNGLKRDLCFATLDDAKIYLQPKRSQSGYADWPTARTPKPM